MPTSLLERNIVQVKRLQKASRQLEVIPHEPEAGRYMVESESHPGELYTVTLNADGLSGHCTCRWGQNGGINCKHVLAALRFHHAEQGTLSFWRSRAEARRQHRRTLKGDTLFATVRPRRR
ncbi:MAG: SWIM zinc finger domain-containing protein [Chloroflexaceae bacterium]|jgi:hypothetical protein|nr:SWIM zinc finger domain-containing protein [Chloroflexaceae bacterium]